MPDAITATYYVRNKKPKRLIGVSLDTQCRFIKPTCPPIGSVSLGTQDLVDPSDNNL